jgi:hypothetical protein
MPFLISSLPKILRVLVRREYTQNLEVGHGQYLAATVIGVRVVEGLSLQFQVRFDDPSCAGAMFCLPIQAVCWKPCVEPPIVLIQPWDCFSSTFGVCEFDLLKNSRGWILNKGYAMLGLPERIESKYVCTIDFTGTGLADDFEQHKQLHIVKAAGGWIAAVPNNRWLSDDPAFGGVCAVLPVFKSLARDFSSECELP